MPLKRRAPSISFSEAYSAAQSFLVHIGSPPGSISEGADGIVDMIGDGFYSRLRYDDAPIGQGAILGLLKQTEDTGARPILFSASGFTGAAEVFGEHLGVAMFAVGRYGEISSRSPTAHHLMPSEPFEPPFRPEDYRDPLGDRPPGAWSPADQPIADHEWVDCSVCGTTHHPEANFCHRCGAQLTRKHRIDPTGRREDDRTGGLTPEGRRKSKAKARPAAEVMRCNVCGSHDIEVVRD